MEQNLILCMLQTLLKPKHTHSKKCSGLRMSLQVCFYYIYSVWVMWGICPAHHGYKKQAWQCPNQKTVFHRHIVVNISSQLISVEVWVSEGEYEEESTPWDQCCLELDLVTFIRKAQGCPLELVGMSTKIRHSSVSKDSTPVSVLMYFTEVIPPFSCDFVWRAPLLALPVQAAHETIDSPEYWCALEWSHTQL